VENKEWRKNYLGSKRGHLTRFLSKTKERAAAQNLPHDIDLEYLESIAGLHCPVFGTPFVWGQGNGKHPYRPSVDRIIPELGYVKGNVVFISLKANTIKQDVTEKELYAVADWLHEARKKVNVNERPAAPLSEGTDSQSEHDAKRRTLLAARLGEDRNHPDDHSGTIPGQDAHHSTQASSGDSVGCRSEKVETPFTVTSIQIDGKPKPKISWVKFGGRHLFS